MIDVSLALKLFRERNNKSEEESATYLGIQKKAYKRYETGEREPSIEKLYKLAKFYNCSIDDFINVEENFLFKREDCLSVKDIDNLGYDHQFSHALIKGVRKGIAYEQEISFTKNDNVKYVLKKDVKSYLLDLIARLEGVS